MRQERILKLLAAIVLVLCAAAVVAFANTSTGNLNFTKTALLRPDGSSEPELRIRADGTVGMVALSWENFVTHLWSAPFGGTATFRGEVDSTLQITGQRQVFGGGDADVDLASTGTLHATTLIFITPPMLTTFQLGVSAITCPGFTLSAPSIPGGCKPQIIDTADANDDSRPSCGNHLLIFCHLCWKTNLFQPFS